MTHIWGHVLPYSFFRRYIYFPETMWIVCHYESFEEGRIKKATVKNNFEHFHLSCIQIIEDWEQADFDSIFICTSKYTKTNPNIFTCANIHTRTDIHVFMCVCVHLLLLFLWNGSSWPHWHLSRLPSLGNIHQTDTSLSDENRILIFIPK